MAVDNEYHIKDVYPGNGLRWTGRLYTDQGQGALIDQNGEATVWKNQDLNGGLLVTERVAVTIPEIHTGNVTTCCIASAKTSEGEKLLVHARFPCYITTLLGYG